MTQGLDRLSGDILSVYAECKFKGLGVTETTKRAVCATLNIQLSRFGIDDIADFLDLNYFASLRKIAFIIDGCQALGDMYLKASLILILAGKKRRLPNNIKPIHLTEMERSIDGIIDELLTSTEQHDSIKIGDVISLIGKSKSGSSVEKISA